MVLKSLGRIFGVLLGCAFLLVVAPLAKGESNDSSRIEVETRLAPAAMGIVGSSGSTDYRIRAGRRDFSVEIEKVPVGAYQFFVNGVEQGTIMVVAVKRENRGELEFADPARTGRMQLNFDPDGALFEVKQGGVTILAALAPFSGQPGVVGGGAGGGGAASFTKQKLRVEMVVQDGSRSRGKLEFNSSKGKAKLKAEFKRLALGHYILSSNSVVVFEFDISSFSRGSAKVEFSSVPKSDDLLLSFDPLNSDYELRRDTVLILSGSIGGQPIGNGVLPLGEVERPFTNLGLDADAVGRARLVTRAGRVDFKIEVEDLPAGTYQIFVDGLIVADMLVAASEDGTNGEVEFRAPTAEVGKLLLTFDPQGRTIQVGQGAMVYLSLVF